MDEKLQEYLESARKSDTKKFETWEVGPPEGSGKVQPRYTNKVEIRIVTRGRCAVGFRAIFSDGHKFHDTDLAELRKKVLVYAQQQLGWEFEYVLQVEVTGEPYRDRDMEGYGTAELGITYTRYKKVKGQDIFYDMAGHRWYGRTRNVIPWNKEREAALADALEGLNRARARLMDILDVKKAAATLDAAVLGRLLPIGSEHGEDTDSVG